MDIKLSWPGDQTDWLHPNGGSPYPAMMFKAGSSLLSDAYSSTRDLPSSFGLRIGKEMSLFDETFKTRSLFG